MNTYFLRLFEHAEWANRRVLDLLRRSETPPDRARLWFAHILAAERIWLERLRGNNVDIEVWPEMTLDACAELSAENADGYREFLSDLPEDGLEEKVSYKTTAGAGFKTAARDILTHVALHGAYHRGQVAAVIREEGEKPPTTDYVMFVRNAG